MRIEDLKNPNRISGYNYVHYSGPKNGPRPSKPYQAIQYGGTGPVMDTAGRRWRGTRRATPEESAQDYCDYIGGTTTVQPAKLKRAGHVTVGGRTSTVKKRRVSAQPVMAGYVYFISDGTAVKIGKAVNPSIRIRELQTGNPRLLTLLGTVYSDDMAKLEADMHRKFPDLNVLGEWFQLHPTIFAEFKTDGAEIEHNLAKLEYNSRIGTMILGVDRIGVNETADNETAD